MLLGMRLECLHGYLNYSVNTSSVDIIGDAISTSNIHATVHELTVEQLTFERKVLDLRLL